MRSISTSFQNTGGQTVGYPQNVVVNSSTGDIYVAATGTVRRYNSEGSFISAWTPLHNSGGQNPIALDPTTGDILATDGENTIQRFSSTGVLLGSFGDAGTDPGQFSLVSYLAVDEHGNVYAVDANHTIYLFSGDGTFLTSFGSLGTNDDQFMFQSIGNLTVSSTNTVYVSDTRRIMVFQTTLPDDGTVTTTSVTTPPQATITGGKSFTTTKAKFTLKGKVPAGSGVANVKIKVGKSPYKNAHGTTSWSFPVPLKPGANKVLVETVNASGNTSAPVKVKITRTAP